MTSLGWAVLRCIGTAARAFSDAVDAEHQRTPAKPTEGGSEPTVKTFGGGSVTKQTLPCPFCGTEGVRAPAAGKDKFLCQSGHHFDRAEVKPAT